MVFITQMSKINKKYWYKKNYAENESKNKTIPSLDF